MGWPRVAVYDGGWYEWSRNPDQNPIAVGPPEEPDADQSVVT
jgi:thiosulfate/3-mercaptopyruvate sulfurtransferase